MEYKKIIMVLQENHSTSICCIAQARWRGFFTTDILRGRRVCKSKKESSLERKSATDPAAL